MPSSLMISSTRSSIALSDNGLRRFSSRLTTAAMARLVFPALFRRAGSFCQAHSMAPRIMSLIFFEPGSCARRACAVWRALSRCAVASETWLPISNAARSASHSVASLCGSFLRSYLSANFLRGTPRSPAAFSSASFYRGVCFCRRLSLLLLSAAAEPT